MTSTRSFAFTCDPLAQGTRVETVVMGCYGRFSDAPNGSAEIVVAQFSGLPVKTRPAPGSY